MKHLKTPQELNESSENLNISDVRSSDNTQIDFKKHAEQFLKEYFSGSGYSNQDIINCMSFKTLNITVANILSLM